MEKQKSKIPQQVLIDILQVYELGKREHLKLYANDYIASRHNKDDRLEIWTNWTDIFDIRDRIKSIKVGGV